MRKIIVKKNNSIRDIMAIKYITNEFKSVPYSAICKALRNKDIRINGIKICKDTLVKQGDEIDIYINDNILFNIPKEIKYYYEDDNILIAFKKQGILSNNEDENNSIVEPTFEELVIENTKNSNIKICHRLDRNTSGLIIFSKNNRAYLEILDGFKNNKIHKEYIAFVANHNFSKEHDILEAYLVKDIKQSYSKISSRDLPNSEKISTEYTVLEKNINMDYAKLNIVLHTGKTHQIRAHLASINHPIIGDSKYGKNEINKKFKRNKQCLYACKYTFSFDSDSILSYLNKINVSIEKNLAKL